MFSLYWLNVLFLGSTTQTFSNFGTKSSELSTTTSTLEPHGVTKIESTHSSTSISAISTTPTRGTTLKHQPTSHFKFASSAQSCHDPVLKHSYLQEFATFFMANGESAKAVCGVQCLASDKCIGYGLKPDNKGCVLFMRSPKVGQSQNPLPLTECFFKI